MELNMYLDITPDTIKCVFGYIAIIVAFAVVGKVAIHSIKNGRKVANKQNKEES
jgi:hypothetical protein